MKALVYEAYGTPDVLTLRDVDTPAPGEGQVLVRVQASSINDFDFHLLSGKPIINRIGAPFRPKYAVLGSDVAGIVESVGPGVTRLRVGDEVLGDMSTCGFGAFAEYVCAPEGTFAAKPSHLTFEQAAAIPQAGGLAVTALYRGRPLAPGRAVLVNGAGGGVGTFAVQIAKAHGCVVTGVDLAAKLDAVLAAGADHVIDYTREDFTAHGRRYDVIVEIAAHRPMSQYRRSLNAGGVCSVTGGSIPRVLFAMAAGPALSIGRSTTVRLPMWRPNNPDDVAYLMRLVDDGSVAPVVDSVVPLADVPEALRRFGAQRHTGKIVVSI